MVVNREGLGAITVLRRFGQHRALRAVQTLLEVWVDVVTREYSRLYVPRGRLLDCTDLGYRVSWPLVSQKHDDVSNYLRTLVEIIEADPI